MPLDEAAALSEAGGGDVSVLKAADTHHSQGNSSPRYSEKRALCGLV